MNALREELDRGRRVAERAHRSGASGEAVTYRWTDSVDSIVRKVFAEILKDCPALGEISLIALGSYGRRGLSPYSDIDLLVLRDVSNSLQSLGPGLQAVNSRLWDLKLDLGWSLRTSEECEEAAQKDSMLKAALFDCRLIAGNSVLFEKFQSGMLRKLFHERGDEFINIKIGELKIRREKFGGSLYLLEPQVKEGEGGLRDLETALVIAQVRFRARGLRGLLRQSVLGPGEVADLRRARDFLQRVRNQLHFSARRKDDRLSFESQQSTADFFGCRTDSGETSIDQFMLQFYSTARALRAGTDSIVQRCEEESGLRRHIPTVRKGPFKIFRGALTFEGDPEDQLAYPSILLEAFKVAEEEKVPIYSWAKQAIRGGRDRIANSREKLAAVFKGMLMRPGTRGQFLFEMHELGILGALLPEFERLTAKHLSDMYHVYTVDLHSLFVTGRLYSLRAGDLLEQEQALTRQIGEVADPLPLYLAGLLHDTGKGLGGNHPTGCENQIQQAGERLQLDVKQLDLLSFLVRSHLLMSQTAQRRDLSDPDLIRWFADQVKSVERLNLLHLLTYADISSVAPQIWTEWKRQLLGTLFEKTRAYLIGDRSPSQFERPDQTRHQFLLSWAKARGSQGARELADSLPDRYFAVTQPKRASHHARLLESGRRRGLAVSLRPHLVGDFSELTVSAPDRPRLLAMLAGALSAHQVQVLKAEIFSTSQGMALDFFNIQTKQGKSIERRRWSRIRSSLRHLLLGTFSMETLLERHRTLSLLDRPLPSVIAIASIDNRISRSYSVVDVQAEDRPGLLYDLTSALAEAGCEIASARVSTEANRALGSFYVSRQGAKLTEGVTVERLRQDIIAVLSLPAY